MGVPVNEPSEVAVEAALTDYISGASGSSIIQIAMPHALKAAHDPKLGLDMSVNLHYIIDFLRNYDGPNADYGVRSSFGATRFSADLIEQQFINKGQTVHGS